MAKKKASESTENTVQTVQETQNQEATNKDAMLKALEKSMGIVSTASKMCQVHRNNHYYWMATDPEYAYKVKSFNNISLDMAESQLLKKIQDGELKAIIFYLKTKGKERGYTDKVDHETKNFDITIDVDGATDNEPVFDDDIFGGDEE